MSRSNNNHLKNNYHIYDEYDSIYGEIYGNGNYVGNVCYDRENPEISREIYNREHFGADCNSFYGICIYPETFTGVSVSTTESYGLIKFLPISPKQLSK